MFIVRQKAKRHERNLNRLKSDVAAAVKAVDGDKESATTALRVITQELADLDTLRTELKKLGDE